MLGCHYWNRSAPTTSGCVAAYGATIKGDIAHPIDVDATTRTITQRIIGNHIVTDGELAVGPGRRDILYEHTRTNIISDGVIGDLHIA